MGAMKLTDTHIGIVLGMHAAGASQRTIALQLGVSQPAISKALRRHNLSTFNKCHLQHRYLRHPYIRRIYGSQFVDKGGYLSTQTLWIQP